MPDITTLIRWDSYAGAAGEPGLFARQPLAYNSRQERLHAAELGDSLWLVSRASDDQRYYFVARIVVAERALNEAGSELAKLFGRYRVLAGGGSVDIGRRLPAENLLRSFRFDPERPMAPDASLGQAMQAVRVLDDADRRSVIMAMDRAMQS